jgi:Ni/Fe-hydrogenase b-type cytochrome subunit
MSDQKPTEPLVYRHRLATRLWHWTNAVPVIVMLMSGLMIFNAHPRLYWGEYGANFDPAWFQIGATADTGFIQIGETRLPTTGVLGRWTDGDGVSQARAFPGWATIPSYYSLALARRWHLAFAWVLAFGLLAYMIASVANRHFRRDIALSRDEVRPRHLWSDIKDHAQLRFPRGEAALRYNPLQKIAYSVVIFGLIPLIILTGMTMSPGLDASWPWLLDLFGGRQSARSIHFIAATLIAGFIVVHLLLVLLAGPYNEVRSMITGRFRLPPDRVR